MTDPLESAIPDTRHVPVLSRWVREAFTMPPGLVLDATAGGGGHARLLVELGHRVIAADRDPAALDRLRRVFAGVPQVRVEHADFSFIARFASLDGILADLGFSSDQLGDASRGFSFDAPGPPDMRMDPALPRSAADLVAESTAAELARIIRDFGEESAASAIARSIAGLRFASSAELAAAIAAAKGPARFRPGRRSSSLHPATKTFQALRIAVNDEFGQLRMLLDAAPTALNPRGRIAVIAFHSLEDRMVKTAFGDWLGRCRCPPRLPICACGVKRIAFALWKGAQTADSEEVSGNPRSRSARIRAMEMAGETERRESAGSGGSRRG